MTETKTTKQVVKKKEVVSIGVLKKIERLATLLNEAEWSKDGVNTHQKYKYITEAQYKRVHGQAVREAGLVFKFQVIDRDMVENPSGGSMHITSITAQIEYIDPETGEREVYITFADGADSGDKGIYKAQTGAYKYHVANNFHVAENNDAEDAGGPAQARGFAAKGGFMSPQAIVQAKVDVMSAGDSSDKKDVEALEKIFKEYEKLEPEKAKAFRTSNPDFSEIKDAAMKAILPNITNAVKLAKAEVKK